MSKPLVYLYTSNKAKKKFAAFFPTSKKVIHFGQKPYRDYTLMSDKNSVHYLSSKSERDKVKEAYISRHSNDNLDDPESAGALSMFVLWSAPTLKGGMRTYAKKYAYKVVDKTNEQYSPEKVKELISN
jgi:hypothetical protein